MRKIPSTVDTNLESNYSGFTSINPEGCWSEDYSDENGYYMNNCIMCKETFMGHKRRCVCKACYKEALLRVKSQKQPHQGDLECTSNY